MPPRYLPDRAGFHAAAAFGNLIPVARELIADGDTPVSAFARLAPGEGGFLLESVVGGNKWAAYSFLGVGARATLRVGGGRAVTTTLDLEGGGPPRIEERAEHDPAAALERLLAPYRIAAAEGLPRFFGGAVGYLAYDAVRAWEPIAARTGSGPTDDLGLPDALFVVTDTMVIFDNLRQTIQVVATALTEGDSSDPIDRRDAAWSAACRRIDALCARLAAPPRPLRSLDLHAPAGEPPRSRTPRSEFLGGVRRAQEHILAGDAFQIVLSQRFEADRQGADPFDIYRALRVLNPSPYMFHLQLPGVTVTGASPETLVRLEGDRVEVRPIAGTRPRGATPEDDARLAAELASDEKENAEHVMLIDLGRNDVGHVARIGSVRVEQERVIERYSHVMHLVSLVAGRLADGKSALDVLRAAFPAGTLSGAPKVRAMQIIDALEPVRRGVYGGAVGYLAFPDATGASNLDMAIAIRTVVTLGDRVLIQAGAGIVHDSVPETELEETVHKARAAFRALDLARAAARDAR
ncbi:MAG: anthranilate synthase component I [Myxococcales bacterium]|nr:anthranilate synthase component I [Myxococcales bacterium]